MLIDKISQELHLNTFFDIARAEEIKKLILETMENKTIINFLTIWKAFEVKIYLLSEFSFTELIINRKSQKVTTIALNSFDKILTTEFAKSKHKSAKISIIFDNCKFKFLYNSYSLRVHNFLKSLTQQNAKLLTN